MRSTLDLLQTRARGPRLLRGAGSVRAWARAPAYIALLVVAYDRFNSAWAISLVLLADFVPAMLLGPVFGAAADRWSRRECLIVADLVRAVAFLGIVLVDSFAATVALALLAGAGTGLFTPCGVGCSPQPGGGRGGCRRRLRSYGAITDLGFIAGPALAAMLLLVGGTRDDPRMPTRATFAVSAVCPDAAALRGRPCRSRTSSGAATWLLREARDGRGDRWHGWRPRVIRGVGRDAAVCGALQRAELPLAHRRARRRRCGLRASWSRDLRARLRWWVAVRARGAARRRAQAALPRRACARGAGLHRLRGRARSFAAALVTPSRWPAIGNGLIARVRAPADPGHRARSA